jgi:DNA polymerase-3 subunit alpha
MGEADIVRRKIGKKENTSTVIPEIKSRFIQTMNDKYGVPTDEAAHIAEPFLQVILDASSYGFSLNHSTPYSCIGYACAYLRHYYPLEFLTTMLNINKDDMEKTAEIIKYANQKGVTIEPVKFRKSQSGYAMDKDNNRIYKGIASIKYLNAQVAEELYTMRDKQYATFTDMLVDVVENTSANSKQIEILIKLSFFSEFGHNGKLLAFYEAFSDGKIQYKKTHKDDTKVKRLTALRDYESTLDDKALPIVDTLKAEREYLGFLSTRLLQSDPTYGIIVNVNNIYTPRLTVYHLNSGEEKSYKISKANFYDPQGIPLCSEWDIIKIKSTEARPKTKKVDGKWVKLDETEEWITSCNITKSKL